MVVGWVAGGLLVGCSDLGQGGGAALDAAVSFETAQVSLSAESLVVHANGERFTPASPRVRVDGMRDFTNRETSMVLNWRQHDVEMRVRFFFVSDGVDWWASEVWTYDGRQDSDWLQNRGEFFRQPMGESFEGDVDIGGLEIKDAVIEAFVVPGECVDPSGELALLSAGDVGGLDEPGNSTGVGVALVKTDTCAVVEDVSPYVFTVDVVDAGVVTPQGPLVPSRRVSGVVGAELQIRGAGETELVVTVSARETGDVVDDLVVPVRILPGAGADAPMTTTMP